MLGSLTTAAYDSTTGRVIVNLNNSTINGYTNTVEMFQTYGILSVPLPTQLVNLEEQAPSQVMMTGFNNSIIDSNFSINPGEIANFSTTWYTVTANAGVYIQQAQTANIENAMMGQSTNSVLLDILTYLIALYDWATTHTHSYIPGTQPVSQTGEPTQTVPDDSSISSDQTYIEGNHNLATTTGYMPR